MSDKSELCVACGRFSPADGIKNPDARWRKGRYIDTGDGDGTLWTCTDCAPSDRVEETACPVCFQATLSIETKLVARDVGTFSLSGAQMKFSAHEWPYLVCTTCGLDEPAIVPLRS